MAMIHFPLRGEFEQTGLLAGFAIQRSPFFTPYRQNPR